MSEETAVPVFEPVGYKQADQASGPAWHTDSVRATLKRIRNAPDAASVQAQVTTEAVVLLHSIRRILIWTAVVIPVALLAVAIILLATAPGEAP